MVALYRKYKNIAPTRVSSYWYGTRGNDWKHGWQAIAPPEIMVKVVLSMEPPTADSTETIEIS
jgi:hypothetical protein